MHSVPIQPNSSRFRWFCSMEGFEVRGRESWQSIFVALGTYRSAIVELVNNNAAPLQVATSGWVILMVARPSAIQTVEQAGPGGRSTASGIRPTSCACHEHPPASNTNLNQRHQFRKDILHQTSDLVIQESHNSMSPRQKAHRPSPSRFSSTLAVELIQLYSGSYDVNLSLVTTPLSLLLEDLRFVV